MNRRTRSALVGGVVIAALLLMGAGFPAKTTPAHFVDELCTSVSDWATATRAGSEELDTKIKRAKSLRQVRNLLAEFLGDTAHLTTAALDGLDEAGVPATPKGPEASKLLKSTFKDIRSALRGFHDDAEDVSIKKKKKALKQLRALDAKVDVEFASFTKALGKLKTLDPNHKIEQAFKANAVCATL